MPTDLLEEQQLPSSTVRHRPIAPDVLTQHVKTPRASRARQHHEPHTTDGPPSVAAIPLHRPQARGTWLISVVLGMLLMMVLLWLGQMLWNWGTMVSDDLRYGRPRTTNVDYFVGHETGNVPSHFTALNLSGQIYIIEMPGGSPNTLHLLVGPHLIGPGTDLAPVSLSFPGDPQHPDLLITINGIQVRFHNTGSSYAPTQLADKRTGASLVPTASFLSLRREAYLGSIAPASARHD